MEELVNVCAGSQKVGEEYRSHKVNPFNFKTCLLT